jgi:serine/threonine-protein kinase
VNRAVKVLHPDVVLKRPDLWRRMEMEAQIMNRLAHPNVVRVHDLVATNSQLCVVMDLADGGTLADWLVLLGPMPPTYALGYLVQVLSALAAAHVNGIVHRDVKPQNILVNRRGVAMLSDFGAALHAGPSDDATVVIGTTGFMAPEQTRSDLAVGASADLYAVAATLYALLTTRSPEGLADAPHRSPRWDGLTKELKGLIRKGMRPEPQDRFADAVEMALAFEAARDCAPAGPVAPFDPSDPEFFPRTGSNAAHKLGWGKETQHLPPHLPAILIALSLLEDPPVFGYIEVSASLLAEATPENGGTLVAPDDSWLPPEQAHPKNLDALGKALRRQEKYRGTKPSDSTAKNIAHGVPREDPLGYLPDEISQPPLGYLLDETAIADLMPTEACPSDESELSAERVDRVSRDPEPRVLRPSSPPEATAPSGVRALHPVRISPPEHRTPPRPSPAPERPAPAEEPFQGLRLPRLPYGMFFALGMLLTVLVVGFELGGGFDNVVPPVASIARILPAENSLGVTQRKPAEPPTPPEESIAEVPAPKPIAEPQESAPVVRPVVAKAKLKAKVTQPKPAAPKAQTLALPLGRWEGHLGGILFEVVLKGKPSAFRGTATSTFGNNSMDMEVSGHYDAATRSLVFEDLEESEPNAGRYLGTVSEDGLEFDGYFERIDGTSRLPLFLKRKG